MLCLEHKVNLGIRYYAAKMIVISISVTALRYGIASVYGMRPYFKILDPDMSPFLSFRYH